MGINNIAMKLIILLDKIVFGESEKSS